MKKECITHDEFPHWMMAVKASTINSMHGTCLPSSSGVLLQPGFICNKQEETFTVDSYKIKQAMTLKDAVNVRNMLWLHFNTMWVVW